MATLTQDPPVQTGTEFAPAAEVPIDSSGDAFPEDFAPEMNQADSKATTLPDADDVASRGASEHAAGPDRKSSAKATSKTPAKATSKTPGPLDALGELDESADSADADALLASMADDAIDQMLSHEGQNPAGVGSIEADLTPEEAAALGEPVADNRLSTSEPAEPLSDAAAVEALLNSASEDAFANIEKAIGTTDGPTDAELDALLRAEPEDLDETVEQVRSGEIRKVAEAVEAEAAQTETDVAMAFGVELDAGADASEDALAIDTSEMAEVSEALAGELADELDRETEVLSAEMSAEMSEDDLAELSAELSADLGEEPEIVADDALEERTHDVAQSLEIAEASDTDAELAAEPIESVADTVARTTAEAKSKKPAKKVSKSVEQKLDQTVRRRQSVVVRGTRVALTPLAWMNAPLAKHPTARDAVGKLAMVTTLNASAILTYIFLIK